MSLPTETGQRFPPVSTQSVAAAGGMMPTYIAPTEIFTVPTNRQGLYATGIDNEGQLIIEGVIIEVS